METLPLSKSGQRRLCTERKRGQARGRKAGPRLPLATCPPRHPRAVTLSPDAGVSVRGAVTAPPCLPTGPPGRARRGGLPLVCGPLPTTKPVRPSHWLPLPLHCGRHTVTRTSVTISSAGTTQCLTRLVIHDYSLKEQMHLNHFINMMGDYFEREINTY